MYQEFYSMKVKINKMRAGVFGVGFSAAPTT